MNQVNAVIDLDVRSLGRDLRTLQARQFSSLVVKIFNAPDDTDNVFIRVFKPNDGGFHDVPCSVNSNGEWRGHIFGTIFSETGNGIYEIHATDAHGYNTALGRGRTRIYPFSVGGTAIPNGSDVTVAVIPDATGALHQVVAVNLDGDWTWEIRAVES